MSVRFRLLFGLFGLILLALAAAIVFEPLVLAWTAAAVIGLVGLGIVVTALVLRRARHEGQASGDLN